MKNENVLLSSLVCVLVGCTSRLPISYDDVDLALEQSHSLVKVGETVTFTARATGVTGRDEEIRWESKGGDLSFPEDSKKFAQVEFDRVGSYAVVAKLLVDGKVIDQETAVVQVEPLGVL